MLEIDPELSHPDQAFVGAQRRAQASARVRRVAEPEGRVLTRAHMHPRALLERTLRTNGSTRPRSRYSAGWFRHSAVGTAVRPDAPINGIRTSAQLGAHDSFGDAFARADRR